LVFDLLPVKQAGLPNYTGIMIILAVDLHYDLVYTHITAADFPYVDITCTCNPLYQYQQELLFPDLTRNIQGSRGT
jgi:hypothetical protein